MPERPCHAAEWQISPRHDLDTREVPSVDSGPGEFPCSPPLTLHTLWASGTFLFSSLQTSHICRVSPHKASVYSCHFVLNLFLWSTPDPLNSIPQAAMCLVSLARLIPGGAHVCLKPGQPDHLSGGQRLERTETRRQTPNHLSMMFSLPTLTRNTKHVSEGLCYSPWYYIN